MCKQVLLVISLFFCVTCSLKVYRINEESGKGDYIGNIPQDIPLPPLSSSDVPRDYVILQGEDEVEVNSANGDLRTKKVLDRESLCRDNPPECKIDVEVAVKQKNNLQLIKIQVIVNDLNDNTPAFPSDIIPKKISESAMVGSLIRLDSAIDPDLPQHSIQRYEISSSPPGPKDKGGTSVPLFNLDVISITGGTKIPQLQLSEKLDREKLESYTLLLYAIDGGTPAQTGTATVQIEVTDSNDNQPSFSQSSYSVEVREDVRPGYEIITLTATDLDEGPNARIKYSFPSIVGDHERVVFDLNPSTGVISVTEAGLDFENKTVYHLTVEAQDSGPNPASDYTTVIVHVVDVNDEAPVIDVNFMDFATRQSKETAAGMDQPETFLIKENIEVGTYLAFVTVTDRDTEMNGNVSCRLKESESFAMTTLEANENRYLIKTISELDRETERLHNVQIEAWDFGHPPQRSSKTIVIELMDENDNDPSFGKEIYKLSVSENVRPGEVIATLTAEDPDDGENARITYSISPESNSSDLPFGIHPQSGGVYFIENAPLLDAENQSKPFRMIVTASDNGNPKRNATTVVQIVVTDENDNSPSFKERTYVFNVKEDAKIGHFIGAVVASDADIDKSNNGKVTYSFEEETTAFSIEIETGIIHFRGAPEDLDREARHSQPYVLTVRARDHGNVPRTATCYVEIYLIDVNDNKPVVTFPDVQHDIVFLYIKPRKGTNSEASMRKRRKQTKRSVEQKNEHRNKATNNATSNTIPAFGVKTVRKSSLRKALLIGSTKSSGFWRPTSSPVIIARILATDADEGENGRVRFSLSKGNTYDYFAVDMQSGNVSLTFDDAEKLRQMKRGCHVIEVNVNDLGKPSQQSKTWVNIYVTDDDPNEVNSSKAMQSCMNNSFYPAIYLSKPDEDDDGGLSMITIYIIAGGASLILFIIIVVVICKCKDVCCGKKARTYNCKSAADRMYSDANYTRGSPSGSRRIQGSHQHLPNGVMDNRTSFYSDWTASQMRLAQEKGDMMMQEEVVDGSVGSRNSAKDSGTGDSMPSDAYHTTVAGQSFYGRQPNSNHPYQRHSQAPVTSPYQPSHVYVPPQDDLIGLDEGHRQRNLQYPANNSMVYGANCTNECQMYGHSDSCWMPSSTQGPGSHMKSFRSTEEFDGDSLKYRKRAMTPNSYTRHTDNLRPTNTPYYYDPGSKFDNAQSRGQYSQYRDDNMGSDTGNLSGSQIASSNISRQPSANYRHPGYPAHGQIAQPAYARSPVPFSAASENAFMGQPLGKAYVNLQGGVYDPTGAVHEEAHSNLSSSSSNNQHQHYQNPHSYPQQYYPQEQTFSSHQYPPSAYHGYEPAQEYGGGPDYEDNFAATNLLLSPVESGVADYKQRLERQMNQQQQTQRYDYGDPSEADGRRLPANDQGNVEHGENNASTDKLSTIREELDADEVVAEIDGLLL